MVKQLSKILTVFLLIGMIVFMTGCGEVYEEKDYVPSDSENSDSGLETENQVIPELINSEEYVEIGEMI